MVRAVEAWTEGMGRAGRRETRGGSEEIEVERGREGERERGREGEREGERERGRGKGREGERRRGGEERNQARFQPSHEAKSSSHAVWSALWSS